MENIYVMLVTCKTVGNLVLCVSCRHTGRHSFFCELITKIGETEIINLVTGFANEDQKADIEEKLVLLQSSLNEHGTEFKYKFNNTIHDREITLDNGWIIKIGRGFDIYQKPDNWFSVGSSDLDLRPCLETKVDIYRSNV